MPFVTEELWQRIPRRLNDTTPSIIKASYPQYDAQFDDPESEKDYELIIDIVRSTRSALHTFKINKNGQVTVQVSDASELEMITQQSASIVALVKPIDNITVISSEDSVPSGCYLETVTPSVTVHALVKGLVDLDAEIKRQESKLSKTIKSKHDLEKTISKKDYNEKASESAKELNTKKLEDLDAEISGIQVMIANFEKLKL